MSHLVIARKWRPQGFETVIGQEHVTRTLKNAISSSRIAHAFLFSGPRGVGKTTTARILAKALNCEQGPSVEPCNECEICKGITKGTSLDIIEIDGASNNSVDDIRDLRERVRYTPTKAKYKVYIIDEVHMLSTSAFNALLKTLEEPPEHVIFIMATTDPQKVPATILSRCQHFAFRRIPTARIVSCLEEITRQEKVKITSAALYQIARAGDGSLRDAQSILEQVLSYGDDIDEEIVLDLLGVLNRGLLEQITTAIVNKNAAEVLLVLDKIAGSGYNLGSFHQQLLEYFRNVLICTISAEGSLLADLPAEELAHIQELAKAASQEELSLIIKLLLEAGDTLKKSPNPRIVLELYLTRLAQISSLTPLSQLMEKMISLERKIGSQGIQVLKTQNVEPAPKSVVEDKKIPAQTVNKKAEEKEPAKEPVKEPVKANVPQDKYKCWQKIIEIVQQEKAPLGAVLAHGALLSVNDSSIEIAFDSSLWLRKVEDVENLKVLTKAVGQLFQCPMKVVVKKELLGEGKSLTAYLDGEQEKKEQQLKKKLMAEPVVAAALDIFKAEILEVREKSE